MAQAQRSAGSAASPPEAHQLVLLTEPGPAATEEGRRLLEARARRGLAAAMREYVEEQEQPRRAEG